MRLLSSVWLAIACSAWGSSRVEVDAATKFQIRSLRQVLKSGLEMLSEAMQSNRQLNGQFPAFLDATRWACKETRVFESESGEVIGERIQRLGETLAASEFFTQVIPTGSVRSLFDLLKSSSAAYKTGFQADHLKAVGSALDSWLLNLSLSGNKRIRDVLLDISSEKAFRERARVANSLASFLALVVQRHRVEAAETDVAAWYDIRSAMRAIRRFNNVVLPVPVETETATYFFTILQKLVQLISLKEQQQDGLNPILTDVLRNFPELDTADMLYLGDRAKKLFLGSPRTAKLVRFYAQEFLRKHADAKEKGCELFAIGCYYVAKSMIISPQHDDQSLAETFLHRLGSVVATGEYSLTESVSKLFFGIVDRIRLGPSREDNVVGLLPRRISRFLGFSGCSDFNDSLMTQLVAIRRSEIPLDDVQAVYYDCEVHAKLRTFFGDEDETEPGFDFPTFMFKEIRKVAQLKEEAYRSQRKSIEPFLKDLFSFGRETIGALLKLIATRPDYATEASVIIRLSEYGLRFHDSKTFAQVAARIRPSLMGHDEEEDEGLLGSMSFDSEELREIQAEQESEGRRRRFNDGSNSDESGEFSDSSASGTGGDSGSSAQEGSDENGNINASLGELLSL